MVKQIGNTGKKYMAAVLFSWIVCLPVYAQFEAQMSQYMFHSPTFNPASVGENQMINVTGQHRIQWLGMPGAPQTTYFSLNSPFQSGKKVTHGLGIKFLNDKIGAFTNRSAHLQYAYKRKIGKGTASLGMDVGFVSVGFVYDSIKNATINSEFHDFMGDAAIPTADETGMNLDLTLGAYYSAPKYYLGVSYVHLNAPRIKLNDEKSEFNVRGVLYATGGYDVQLANPKFMIRSSSLFKSDFITWQAELSSRAEYDKKYWGGLSYRFQDAVVVFAGISIMNGMTIGYAYDLPTGKMLTVSSGSHEIYLSYSFLFDTNRYKNRYKSIRIL